MAVLESSLYPAQQMLYHSKDNMVKSKNLYILAFTMIVVMLGFGMVIPIFPFYIDRLGASGSALGLLVATAALTEFLFGPIWGSISDQTGRKPMFNEAASHFSQIGRSGKRRRSWLPVPPRYAPLPSSFCRYTLEIHPGRDDRWSG